MLLSCGETTDYYVKLIVDNGYDLTVATVRWLTRWSIITGAVKMFRIKRDVYRDFEKLCGLKRRYYGNEKCHISV